MVGIVFIGNIENCPYLSKYVKVLESENVSYEVLFWNRSGIAKKYDNNYISFNLKSDLKKKPINKILDFIKFRKWLTGEVERKKYKKLIILSTLSGVFIYSTLIKEYKYLYIFDIRDYSYEHIKPFKKIEDKIIRNSFFTCISSNAFKNFLTTDISYLLVHNYNSDEIKYKKIFSKKAAESTLNLVFIGGMRYFNHQSSIIDRLKNDNRYNIIYHGRGVDLDKYKEYCAQNSIKNVRFTGEYDNSNKYKLLEDADILNNSYDMKIGNEVKYAISNKYYDGLIFGIPQLVEVGSYKHDKVSANGLGIGLDVNDENFANKLYEYYHSIDIENFNKSCIDEISRVIEDDDAYIKELKGFLLNNNYRNI